MTTSYTNGRVSAWTALGMRLIKVADDAPESASTDYTPALAGLGLGALAGGGLYKYMRDVKPTSSAFLQDVRAKAKDRFVRQVEEKTPDSWFGRMKDKIRHAGGDDVYYVGDHPYQPDAPKKVKGAVRYIQGDRENFVKGDVGLGATLADDKRQSALQDKWREYKTIEKHAPGAMSRTENLADIAKQLGLAKPTNDVETAQYFKTLQDELHKRFGKGFVMKETRGVQSAGMFPSETHDLHDLLKKYRESGGAEQAAAAQKELDLGGFGGDDMVMMRKLRENPHYAGRVLEHALKHPKQVIVQERLPLAKTDSLVRRGLSGLTGDTLSNEMRVHVEGGRVMHDATTPRYSTLGAAFDRNHVHGANTFAQSVVDQLPEEYKNISFGMDISPIEGGGYRLIESNPTGNSGFLAPKGGSPLAGIQLRKHYLGNYSKPVAGAAAVGAGLGTAGVVGAGLHYGMRPDAPEPTEAPVVPTPPKLTPPQPAGPALV